jgi:hypothetical protein
VGAEPDEADHGGPGRPVGRFVGAGACELDGHEMVLEVPRHLDAAVV